MKRKILAGIFGLGLMVSLVGVNAETIDSIDETSTGGNVTVWNVDVPVYDVEIEWENMTYNWQYNDENGQYEWRNALCSIVPEKILSTLDEESFNTIRNMELYTDKMCSTSLAEQGITYEEFLSENIENYYYRRAIGGAGASIEITDNSIVYSIVPSVEWTSSENYDWTYATFNYDTCDKITNESEFNNELSKVGHVYENNNCKNYADEPVYDEETTYYKRTTNTFDRMGEISENNKLINGKYDIWFNLNIDESKEIKTPAEGDIIGTVTVSIKDKQ